MLAPLSWLKDYVNITLKPKILGERLTEVGLGMEKIIPDKNDLIFELEITPNRPDLLSILGIAREIAAIENTKIKYPKIKHDSQKIKPAKILPLEIKPAPEINPRFTGIIIDGITVKPSPSWLQERLIKIGQRPINNIVDITNYVMFELGNPIHAFDYDKIEGHYMEVKQAKGTEVFKSVDGIDYQLPKGAVVIADKKKIIDLCGIKGGFNSGTFENTKTIFIRIPVEDPVLTRRTSQNLGLRSEASSIFERGVNKGGTIEALNRCVDLVLELAGGEIASQIYDIKKHDFLPWKLQLRITRLNQFLGINIPDKEVISLLTRLNLSPKKMDGSILQAIIPTYRNDLKIEEDLIEEVARLYGLNNFPKTMPAGEVPTTQVPYYKNYRLDEKIKNILTACDFSEIYTYSLISAEDLKTLELNPDNILKIYNPVSSEFKYLRPALKINLLKALKQNLPNFKNIDLFELGKVYLGSSIDKTWEEYHLAGISNNKNYYQIKGILEKIFEELGVKTDPVKYIEIIGDNIIFELNYSELLKLPVQPKIFKPVPKYPPVFEDLSLVMDANLKIGEIIQTIKQQSKLITEVSVLDSFENSKTFHLVFQHQDKNLTKEEVTPIREKILQVLAEKFGAKLKQ